MVIGRRTTGNPGALTAGEVPAATSETARRRCSGGRPARRRMAKMPSKWSKTPLRDLRTYGGKRAPRLDECDYRADEIVHLTICAANETPFRDETLARMICDNVEFYAKHLAFRLFGYCLMPDHLHVLLSPAHSGKSISDWLRSFKSYTGHEFVKLGHRPPLWQRSAYDHVCRKNETAEAVLIYIANNPVRAGLVQAWNDWPWTKVFVEI